MSNLESRPLPLRVPVVDVAMRSSLFANQARGRENLNPALIVVQRPVRIISDPPPPPVGSEFAQAFGAQVQRRAEPENGAPDLSVERAREFGDRSGQRALDDDDDDHELDTGRISTLELDDDELARSAQEIAEAPLQISVPPPAPPEALRKTPSNPAGQPVSRTDPVPAQFETIEELQVELEARPALSPDEPRFASPLPARPALPEPPDLATLTRAARVQELRPTKPRSFAWWEVFFDDDYLRTVRPPARQQIAHQCDFIERRLGLKPGATVLDVGCGLGLHVIELTARGYASVGLDLSLAMLSRASEEAQVRGLRINFLHADMRDLSFEASFDAVTCLGTSLGYFDDDANRRVLDRLFRALKPGGALLLDVVNRDYVIRSQPNLIWFEGDGCVCMEESEFNFITSRLQVKRTVILDNGRQVEHEYSLRLYSLHELGQLMNASGFRVTEVSGRDALPGVFFGHESPNLMIVAERRLEPATPASPNADERG